MQRTPPRTRSQGPAQHPLDPDLVRRRRRSPSDLQISLESVPGLIRNRGNPGSNLSNSLGPVPAKGLGPRPTQPMKSYHRLNAGELTLPWVHRGIMPRLKVQPRFYFLGGGHPMEINLGWFSAEVIPHRVPQTNEITFIGWVAPDAIDFVGACSTDEIECIGFRSPNENDFIGLGTPMKSNSSGGHIAAEKSLRQIFTGEDSSAAKFCRGGILRGKMLPRRIPPRHNFAGSIPTRDNFAAEKSSPAKLCHRDSSAVKCCRGGFFRGTILPRTNPPRQNGTAEESCPAKLCRRDSSAVKCCRGGFFRSTILPRTNPPRQNCTAEESCPLAANGEMRDRCRLVAVLQVRLLLLGATR
ncbi:hypothetical protein VP01_2276g3 [Puccinia sorghi]|uniref:Uncharacterized protein n=1 Tax=Puccinia sorghi TaxID=27349 RepID=A0A0L6V8X5_9BASI|nr:hypothetical protein VP01_2276g3 [Puccinia sorghi]